MKAEQQRTVAVVGAGVIGTGVAYACLQAGYNIVLVDRPGVDWASVRSALRAHRRLALLTGAPAPVLDHRSILETTDLSAAHGAYLVVENVTENREAKREVYSSLAAAGLAEAYVAANTSAIPIDDIAEHAPEPSRVVGVHFMNPVPAVDTVEVVRGPRTSDATLGAVGQLLDSMGKRPVIVGDTPGFVINQILMAVVNDAARIVEGRIATAAQVDELFKGCLSHAMGPLRTADLIGIDTVVDTLVVLHDARGDAKFEPCTLLQTMVSDGRLGMKSGRGFHEYEGIQR